VGGGAESFGALMFWGPFPPILTKPPKIGTDYRRRGETMSWRVVSANNDEVKLSGPGPCRGYMVVETKTFSRDWVRV
jgi:hypothetical protein